MTNRDYRKEAYVPARVRSSRTVTWLWRHPCATFWLDYKTAARMARWLP